MSTPLRPVDEKTMEMLGLPPVCNQLPATTSGGANLEEFSVTCSVCDQTMRPELVRGKVCSDYADVITVEAVAACHDCRVITPYSFRVYSDNRMMWKSMDGWKEFRSQKRRGSGRKKWAATFGDKAPNGVFKRLLAALKAILPGGANNG